MSTAAARQSIGRMSPTFMARTAGVFWLLTILGGIAALLIGGRFAASGDAAATAARALEHESLFRVGIATNLVATVCYLAATVLVYELLRPVSRTVSLLAAFFSLAGCTIGGVGGVFRLALVAPDLVVRTPEHALLLVKLPAQASAIAFTFFGLHCLLVGVLVIRSTFLPRIVGALIGFGGTGWLTYSFAALLSPPVARLLSPYILAPGILGEAALTLSLLLIGVNAGRWREQATAGRRAQGNDR